MTVLRILWRLIVVPIGFLAASAAAAGALSAAAQALTLLPWELRMALTEMRDLRPLLDGLIFASAFAVVASVAFLPSVVIAFVAELMAIRHLAFYLVAGGAIGYLAARPPFDGWIAQPLAPAIAAGFVGGFVYWLVAGRGAGLRPAAVPRRPSVGRAEPSAAPAPTVRSTPIIRPPPTGQPGSIVLQFPPVPPAPRRPPKPEPPRPPRPPVVERRRR